MDQEKNAPNICSIHNLEYIAVDFSPQCKKEARFICLQCLFTTPRDKHHFKSVDEAKIYLQDVKGVFLQRKQDQSSKNLEILKDLMSSIQSLKIYYSSYFDKILENLKQQQDQIVTGQEKLISQLQNVDLSNFFSCNHQLIQIQYDQIKNIFQTQIQNLKTQDKIDNCLQFLSKIDDEIIQFAPDQQSKQTEVLKQSKSTPSLPISCETHQMEIICFDLNEQKAKENKIACALCVMNKQGQFIDLLSAQKQWFDYENQKQLLYQSQLDNGRTKIETAQSQFKQLLNKFEYKINEVNKKLASNLISIQDKIQREINNMFKNWLSLSKDEIIFIADTLSKLQHQDTNNKQDQNDFQKDIKKSISVIDDSLRYLVNALQQSYEIISLAIHSEKTNKDAETQSDIEFRQTQFQKQSNIFAIACQYNIKQTQNIAIQNQITTVSESNQYLSVSYFGGSSQEKLMMYQMQQDEFRKQIEQLQMDLSATASFSEKLQQRNKELEEEKYGDNKLYQDKIDLLNQQILILEKESDKRIEQLNLRLVEKQQSLIELQVKMSKFSQEKDEQQKQLEQLIKNKEELQNHLLDKFIIIEQLNREIEQHKSSQQITIHNQQEQFQKQIQKQKEELCKYSEIIIHKDETIQAQLKKIDQLSQQMVILETEREKENKISQNRADEYELKLKQCKQQQEEQSNQLTKIVDEKNQQFSKQSKQLNQLQQQKEEESRINKKEIEDGLLQISQLNKQKLELENTLQNQQIIIQQLKVENNKFEQDKQIQETKNFNLNGQIDSLIQQIKSLISENQKQKDDLKQQAKMIEEKNSLISKQSSEYDINQKLLQQQKDDEISKNQKLIEELNLNNKKIEENQQKQQTTIEKLNNQINQVIQEKQEQLKQSNIQIGEINKQLQEFQNQSDQNRKTQDRNIADKNEQLYKQQQENKSLQTQLQNKNVEIENITKNMQNITKELDDKQSIINQLTSKESQVQQEIQNQKKTIQEYEKKIVSPIYNPYEIIKEYSKKQSDSCWAIAFNKEQTIMVAGCGRNKITVFEFKQGQVNQKQLLSDHTSGYIISTLYFMSKSNQFISGTCKEIGIWSYNNNTGQWYCQQLLREAHSFYVYRVIMNKNEDLLISCSDDKTIKFWIKKNKWECSQTLTTPKKQVYSICLNDSCTQLVSCGQDKQILICQQGGDQKWIVIQSIEVDQQGCRICFIDDNVIVFQPSNGIKMETYKLHEQRKLYIKSKDIQVQNDSFCDSFFPMQFNNNKKLLVNKNGNRINLIRKQNDDFIVEQSINFQTNAIYGAMTDDFQYLVTWDDKSKEFQVRKQK